MAYTHKQAKKPKKANLPGVKKKRAVGPKKVPTRK